MGASENKMPNYTFLPFMEKGSMIFIRLLKGLHTFKFSEKSVEVVWIPLNEH